MNPIATVRTLPVQIAPAATAQLDATSQAAGTLTRASTQVVLGQQSISMGSDIYSAKGTLESSSSRYVWETPGVDKLSQYMAGVVQSSSTSTRFQGLGAALLAQLAANGGATIAQSGLLINDASTPNELILGLQQSRLREYASNSITFNLTTASGATVSLGLYSSEQGLAVDAQVQGGTLSAKELDGLAALASSFQSAINGLTQEPPSFQLGALVKLDPSLFTGLQLDAQLVTSSGEQQAFELRLDDQTRSLKLQGPGGEVKMNFDTQGGALLGSQAMRQAAVANYLSQFDAAQARGHGDEQLMSLFKDAFSQLNSVDDNNRLANSATAMNKNSRLLLSGLADFNASISQPTQQPNPAKPDEPDSFNYQVSQSTRIKGGANLSVEQQQQANLKAAWHERFKPLVALQLTRDSESQNYRYHEVNDQSNSTTRLGLRNGVLTDASVSQQATQKERVRTYQNGIELSDVVNNASSSKDRDLLGSLDALLRQDRKAQRIGAQSTLEQQLLGLSQLWLLQSSPTLIKD
ncbi:hypothetical protein BGP84_16635 [Pseudomonas putida]|uniref:Lactate dehydrogenase n=1 Tax=Pseudomonas putida TaxID=303 RepID=A0A2S3X6S2_PSEPU|nr:hypothetical protein [Pseudomonas putida]POG11281.1 hypothetical protein BGP84_16635 [Pseudomonas putida]POG14805.1 hypothetical protein BGP85_01090 [Pseudomonas putida]